jgi:hypothetical protein
MVVHHVDADGLFQSFQFAEDEGAVRPGAGERNIQVIAAGLGLETGLSRRARAAVCGYPVTEPGLLTLEMPSGGLGVVPLVAPFAVD